MKLRRFFILYFACFYSVTACDSLFNNEPDHDKTKNSSIAGINGNSEPLTPQKNLISYKKTSHTIPLKSCVYDSLKKAGLTPNDIYSIIKSSKDIYSLDKVRGGTNFSIHWLENHNEIPAKVDFSISNYLTLKIQKTDNRGWIASTKKHPVTKRIKKFTGNVTSNFWESGISSGMNANLIIKLTQVFAWQVDFNREVKKGDRWRLVVEEKQVQSKFAGWGRILAAEYINNGELYTGILYKTKKEDFSYYTPEGSSLKRMFLKAPMKFGRVTSPFSRTRLHPILKKVRPHLGVDYGAQRGTPILAVGSGRVIYSGWKGQAGKTVKIKHNSTYTTAYCHMSKIASKAKKGSRVKQGQVIGYVGSTGLSTGPHLHFEFYENNRYVDPLGRKFPSKDPVPKEELEAFKEAAKKAIALLPTWKNLLTTNPEPQKIINKNSKKAF